MAKILINWKIFFSYKPIMNALWIFPIVFSVFFIFILSFCIIIKCRMKKKSIGKDIDITKISKYCGLNKQGIPSNNLNDFLKIERINHKRKIAKLQNSLPDTHRSAKNNDSIVINMIVYDSALQRRNYNNIVENINNKHTNLPLESNKYLN
jgi:hypothetical protein